MNHDFGRQHDLKHSLICGGVGGIGSSSSFSSADLQFAVCSCSVSAMTLCCLVWPGRFWSGLGQVKTTRRFPCRSAVCAYFSTFCPVQLEAPKLSSIGDRDATL